MRRNKINNSGKFVRCYLFLIIQLLNRKQIFNINIEILQVHNADLLHFILFVCAGIVVNTDGNKACLFSGLQCMNRILEDQCFGRFRSDYFRSFMKDIRTVLAAAYVICGYEGIEQLENAAALQSGLGQRSYRYRRDRELNTPGFQAF